MKYSAIFLLTTGIVLAGCTSTTEETTPVEPAVDASANTTNTTQPMGDVVITDSGLQIEDLEVGQGTEAVSGNTVSVHYTGTLEDGTKFDSSLDQGTPFEFPLGAGMVIKGWDEGVAGMKEGGKRKLTIPSDLGYGAAGAGSSIPPHATLIFEVELLEVK